jgi:hypothetical protein
MAERRSRRTGLSRLQPLIPLGLIWSAGFLVLVSVALQRRVPYDELLLDPNNLAGVPWYTGLVSNLGILGWTTAAVTAFFGAWIALRGGRRSAARMLVEGAGLATVLLFDDLLQLHVLVEPLLGLPKVTAYALYLILAAHWVATQYAELRRTRYELLLAAGAAFAVSIGFDQVAPPIAWLGAEQRLLVEDAAKFLGVLAWAQYFVVTSGRIVTSIVEELRQAARRSVTAQDRPTQDSGSEPAVSSSSSSA